MSLSMLHTQTLNLSSCVDVDVGNSVIRAVPRKATRESDNVYLQYHFWYPNYANLQSEAGWKYSVDCFCPHRMNGLVQYHCKDHLLGLKPFCVELSLCTKCIIEGKLSISFLCCRESTVIHKGNQFIAWVYGKFVISAPVYAHTLWASVPALLCVAPVCST